MGIISEEVKKLIDDPKTRKSIATIDPEGIPHIAYKGSLHIEEDLLVYYDLLHSSETNKNLVFAMWYDRKVAFSILGENGENYLIIGTPSKCVTAGRLFEETYVKIRERIPTADLGAIWYFEPDKIRDNTRQARQEHERKYYPNLTHLDTIVKPEFL